MLTLLLMAVALAAFFNAVMDAIENENYFESIFRNLNQRFWYKRESWKYAKKVFGYRFDAWHISKTCMIFSWTAAVIFAIWAGISGAITMHIGDILALIGAVGFTWNATFWFVYQVLFKVK